MYIECIGTEFGTLQIRRHIRSVEISDVEITSVDCISISGPPPWLYLQRICVNLNYVDQLTFRTAFVNQQLLFTIELMFSYLKDEYEHNCRFKNSSTAKPHQWKNTDDNAMEDVSGICCSLKKSSIKATSLHMFSYQLIERQGRVVSIALVSTFQRITLVYLPWISKFDDLSTSLNCLRDVLLFYVTILHVTLFCSEI